MQEYQGLWVYYQVRECENPNGFGENVAGLWQGCSGCCWMEKEHMWSERLREGAQRSQMAREMECKFSEALGMQWCARMCGLPVR